MASKDQRECRNLWGMTVIAYLAIKGWAVFMAGVRGWPRGLGNRRWV